MEQEINDFNNQCGSASFLDSFNIDTGAEPDPHFIVNLDAFAASSGQSSTQPSGSTVEGSLELPTSLPVATDIPVPPVPQYSPYVRIGTPKGRSRGSYKPLNEMVETRIRTYEGADSHSKITTLQQHFPGLKRCIVDKCFTKNLLNFEQTYRELFALNRQQQEDMSKIRLILTPRHQRAKSTRVIPNIKAPELINTPSIRGRPSRRSGERYYRRVIVGKDGTVESADVTEKNFVRNSDAFRTTTYGNNYTKPSYEGPSVIEVQDLTSQIESVDTAIEVAAEEKTVVENSTPTELSITASVSTPATTESASNSVENQATQKPVQQSSGNRFFRSNRLSDAEMKKREYVTKELQGQANTRVPAAKSMKNETDQSDTTQDSAANFMAGVGVVSAPASRRRGRKPRGKQRDTSDQEEIEGVTEDGADSEIDDNMDLTREERVMLLSFFNEAPAEELTLMPGCSQKTSEVIINLRPFKNTVELKLRLDATRYLSVNLIDACKELMQARSMFTNLLQSCEAISSRVSERMSSLFTDSVNLPVVDSAKVIGEPDEFLRREKSCLMIEQPVILHPLRQLKPYQMVGLNWLRILHEEHVNGILADEMGLGKTVQAIAFLAYLWENGERGPHLIMCPGSTVENWKRELHNWCSQLKVLAYEGPSDQRKAMRLKIYENGSNQDFNILLTSYTVGTSTLEDRALMKRVDFDYAIFDEGHMLKNMTTQRYKTLSSFQTKRRILLTGTPLQNNLMELISLLAFVMPDMFLTNADHLKRMFQLMGKASEETNSREGKQSTEAKANSQEQLPAKSSVLLPNRSNFERERLEQAKKFLQPFCLRRLKSQVLRQLPPKTEETVYVSLTSTQRRAYLNLVNKFRNAQAESITDEEEMDDEGEEVNLLTSTGKQTKNGSVTTSNNKRQKLSESISGGAESHTTGNNQRQTPYNMLMQLRKASNHELLLSGIAFNDESLKELAMILHKDPSHSEADPALVLEDLCAMSDHQVHKICRLYDVLNPFALPPETLVLGSGKLRWLDENLPKFFKDSHRILIFSQFVIMLDILGEYLVNCGFKFLRMDGSTPVQDRQTLIDTFNSDETYEIFLLSTKAGGLGISLTGADVVILHDLDFNPSNDRQAADRCHRLGQIKPVRVVRLVSEGTVEESIWRSAEEKLRLEEDVTDFEHQDSLFGSVFESAIQRQQQNSLALATVAGKNGVSTTEDESIDSALLSSGQPEAGQSVNKRLLQGEIIKYLSDALSAHSEDSADPAFDR